MQSAVVHRIQVSLQGNTLLFSFVCLRINSRYSAVYPMRLQPIMLVHGVVLLSLLSNFIYVEGKSI